MAGIAILFVVVLTLAWMVGLAVSAHAAHYFLAIAESSSTAFAHNVSPRGAKPRFVIRNKIDWPDDFVADYFVRMFYMGYMVALVGGPAVLIGRVIAGPTWVATAIAGLAFWIAFPIGQLSSLASGSRWNPLFLELFMAFARRPAKTLAFYVLSAPVVAGIFFTFDVILLRTETVSAFWTIALCPIAVLLYFIYARLIGRLGMVVSFALPRQEVVEDKAPKRKRRPRTYDEKTRWAAPRDTDTDLPAADAQPPNLPGLESPNDGIVTGYGVSYNDASPPPEEPKPAPIVHKFDDEDDSPITIAPLIDARSIERDRISIVMAEPPEEEILLHLRERPREPANPYGAETVTFLLDPKTIDAWLRLTIGLIVMTVLQRALDHLRPPLD